MTENTVNIHAPERQVFYIDIGDMPVHQVREYLEKVTNNLCQQKTLSVNSTNDKMVEAASTILEGSAAFLDLLSKLVD